MISERPNDTQVSFSVVQSAFRRRWVILGSVVLLLAVMFIQLAITARLHSMTVDEGNHIYSGYMSWKRFDFGLNPEHPPLVKLLATVPILGMNVKAPDPPNIYFKLDAYEGGNKLLSGDDKETILFRTRMAAALLALLLAALAFAVAREMFGLRAGFLALVFASFDPNLLGHGALVTTDTGIACFMLAAVYAFYRYVESPSPLRLVLAGLAVGLALVTKHSGMFLAPILLILAIYESVHLIAKGRPTEPRDWKRPAKLAAAILVIFAVSFLTVWAFYGFRYSARPQGSTLVPPLTVMTETLKPREAKAVLALARWKLLPESYLAGATDVRTVGEHYHSFVLGKIHPHGVWFYFPVVLAIKSTEALLVLSIAAVAAFFVRRLWTKREFLFLAIPLAIYLGIAMSAPLNTGVRHIMPVYAFLWPLAAGAASTLLRGRWAWALVGLAVLHVGASLATFRNHIPYANLFWGGPNNVHRLLTDSNADWGQQLNAVRDYLEKRNVKDCWFSYIGEGLPTKAAYWGVPCKNMPNLDGLPIAEQIIPEVIEGPVLISADELSGYLTGPGPLNPYGDFQRLRPSAILGGGVLVYDGSFSVPRLSALTRRYQIGDILKADPKRALESARKIVALDPDNADSWTVLGRALLATQQKEEARAALERAIHVAETVEPNFQADKIPEIRSLMSKL